MTGFTLGIVVQNNDPQKRGRVKVFIPHLSMNLLEGWDNLNEDKSFENLSDPFIKDVIDKIKDQLPWANCAAPIFGENGGHYFDSKNKESSTGDSVDKKSDKPSKGIEDTPPTDFKGNKYNHNSYSNSTKGLFSIPRVGSRVWVFFENNNLNRPVYFATSYDKEDWEKIADENYPNVTENIYGDTKTETDGYKNKTVISQRGGVIEIINTDNQESLQISHYNGGFKIWSNGGIKEYVEGEDKKYVKSNSTLHVGGNIDVYIEGNSNIRVNGNSNIQIDGTSNINVSKECSIKSDILIDMTAPDIALHGTIMLDGVLTQGTIGSQGATLYGPLNVTNDVTAGSISLIEHVHGGVEEGSGETDDPS